MSPSEGIQGAGQITQPPMEQPKSVEIREVENGYTVALMGGKQDTKTPFRHRLSIAKTLEEVVELTNNHLK